MSASTLRSQAVLWTSTINGPMAKAEEAKTNNNTIANSMIFFISPPPFEFLLPFKPNIDVRNPSLPDGHMSGIGEQLSPFAVAHHGPPVADEKPRSLPKTPSP